MLGRRTSGDLPGDVYAMCGVAFCVALGFGVVAPAIPLFATEFGVDATAAGAVVSAFAFMRFISGLGAGRLVDWIGERASLVLGLVVVAASSLVAGLSQSYTQLLVLRGVGGVGSAVFGVASISIVLHVASQRVRGRAMSVYRSGFLLGGIVGPGLGGAALGISLRAPFFLYAGTLALASAVALGFLGRQRASTDADDDDADDDSANVEGPVEGADTGTAAVPTVEAPSEAPSKVPEPGLREVLRTVEYQAALVTNLAVGLAVFGLRSALVPLLFVHALHTSNSAVAWAFLVSALVQTALMLPAGRWSDTAGRRPALVTGAFVSAAGLAMLAVGGSVWLAMLAMAVFGAGSAFLGSAPAALVGDVAGRRSGTVVAVFNMASDLGAVVGPVLAGFLVDHGSFAAAFSLGAVVVALAGLLGLRLPAGPAVPSTAESG
jgi:MFS family permease